MRLFVCIPGRTFSQFFLYSYHNFMVECVREGVELSLYNAYDPNLFTVRNACLNMADSPTDFIGRAVAQGAPFGGREYDRLLWIDSDTIFSFDDFAGLYRRDVDMVSALILKQGGIMYSHLERFDRLYYEKNKAFRMARADVYAGKTDLIECEGVGFGFLLCKPCVFEGQKLPVFEQVTIWPDLGGIVLGDDYGFCEKRLRLGKKQYVDPCVKVGHEKSIIY